MLYDFPIIGNLLIQTPPIHSETLEPPKLQPFVLLSKKENWKFLISGNQQNFMRMFPS